jgi:hypothetical protein
MSAAAVIAMRRKRLIRRFRESGAMDPTQAVTLESLEVRRSWIFNQMVNAGVFLPTSDGRYFMDEQAAVEFLYRKRMRVLIGSGLLLLVFLALWACGLLGR